MSTTATRPMPYADSIPKDRIAAYIYKRTGAQVSRQRIARWINSGQLAMMKRPRCLGGGCFTRKKWVDDLIAAYAD